MPDNNKVDSEEPQSFVIRVWREGLGRWRGKISHVQSKDSRAFTRLEESTRFMAERLPAVGTREEKLDSRILTLTPSNLQSLISNSFKRLPRRCSLRLAMAAAAICVVAAIAVLVYPSGDFSGSIVGTAQGSGLETGLIFFLGAVAGGVTVGIVVRLKKGV